MSGSRNQLTMVALPWNSLDFASFGGGEQIDGTFQFPHLICPLCLVAFTEQLNTGLSEQSTLPELSELLELSESPELSELSGPKGAINWFTPGFFVIPLYASCVSGSGEKHALVRVGSCRRPITPAKDKKETLVQARSKDPCDGSFL